MLELINWFIVWACWGSEEHFEEWCWGVEQEETVQNIRTC